MPHARPDGQLAMPRTNQAGAGRWFFGHDRLQAYNPEAARLAWDRPLAFFQSPTAR
jgi:dienelactone hydrolase